MFKKFVSLSLFGLGIFLLVQIIMPVVSYKLLEIKVGNENIDLISPTYKDQSVLGISIQNVESEFPAFISRNQRSTAAPYKEFQLSVPGLKLDKIKVAVDSNNFEQNLAHLPGTALPGEKGNVFITGHSSLPQLFRPDNFKAIFAHLPEVKKGDSIILEAEGQKFEYLVQGIKIVSPKETWIINPPDENGRYVSLMTCVPPGLYLKRLIVLGKLK